MVVPEVPGGTAFRPIAICCLPPCFRLWRVFQDLDEDWALLKGGCGRGRWCCFVSRDFRIGAKAIFGSCILELLLDIFGVPKAVAFSLIWRLEHLCGAPFFQDWEVAKTCKAQPEGPSKPKHIQRVGQELGKSRCRRPRWPTPGEEWQTEP